MSMETHWEEDISFPKRTQHKQGSTYANFTFYFNIVYFVY